jgi:hypothetical protein
MDITVANADPSDMYEFLTDLVAVIKQRMQYHGIDPPEDIFIFRN